MSISTIIKQECDVCGKQAVEASRLKLGASVIIKLTCGHLASYQSQEDKTGETYESIVFSDKAKPRPYQIEAVQFAERANFNCIIADEQGLGKTIEALSLIRLHPDKLLPAVIAVPTTVKPQWLKEIHRICVPDNSMEQKRQFLTQVIQSGKEIAMPGFQIYVVTLDMMKKDGLFDMVEDDIKLLVIDECQRIKNHLSERAKAVQRLARKVDYIIPMSGTPIKNHAGEYFTILNLVAPKRFPHYQTYVDKYCDSYNSGWSQKVGGLRDAKRFKEDTEDIIIRRTKDQVLKDLPSLDRKFFHVDLDPKLNKAYAAALKELEELFYKDDMSSFERGSAQIAIMSRLRHITGISKIDECIDFVTEFLISCNRKITIFTHHKDVLDILVDKLNMWLSDGGYSEALSLHSGLSSDRRAAVVERFKDPAYRIMVASTLAAGEGLNLQFCSDAILLERQWNPPNEEQTEARFHRFGQKNNVSVTYMIAIGTIDEYFTELVEKKRAIVSSAMDGKEMQWDQNSLMKELAETLLTKGRERWRL